MTEVKFRNDMLVRPHKHNALDNDVAGAAWVSNFGFDKDPRFEDAKRVEGLINFLWREHHTSPFEHNFFTFHAEVPIFVSREWVRHRTWSYNEISGRYAELEPTFYLPAPDRPLIQTGKVGQYLFVPGSDSQYKIKIEETRAAHEFAWGSYQRQKAAGIANEMARDVLGTGIYTKFWASANALNVMRFLTLRNAPNALYEIREAARQVEAVFADAMPVTYAAYKRGMEQETKKHDLYRKWQEGLIYEVEG